MICQSDAKGSVKVEHTKQINIIPTISALLNNSLYLNQKRGETL